jgi:hypothetical protein
MQVTNVDRNKRDQEEFRLTFDGKVTDVTLQALRAIDGIESAGHYLYRDDPRATLRAVIRVADNRRNLASKVMMRWINAELKSQVDITRGLSGVMYERVRFITDRVQLTVRTPAQIIITHGMIVSMQALSQVEAATRHSDHSASIRGYPGASESDLKSIIEAELRP